MRTDIPFVQPLARALDRYRCTESDVCLIVKYLVSTGGFLEGVPIWGTGLFYLDTAVENGSKRQLDHVILSNNFDAARKVSGFEFRCSTTVKQRYFISVLSNTNGI